MNHIQTKPGIYSIKNTLNGKVYVGSAKNMRKRLKTHRQALRGKYHPNSHLQAAWNKYGEQVFLYGVLMKCAKSTLVKNEQKFMDQLKAADRRYGYNQRSVADRNTGVTMSEKTKEKLSARTKKRYEDPNERLKTSKHSIEAWKDPISRAKRMKSLKKAAQRPEFKKMSKERLTNPVCVAKKLAALREPKYRKENSKRVKILWSNERYRKNMVKKHKEVCDDKERLRLSEIAKKHFKSPKNRIKKSAQTARDWKDPVYRSKMMKARREARLKFLERVYGTSLEET